MSPASTADVPATPAAAGVASALATPATPQLARSPFGKIRALGEQSGAIVGELYARTAGTLLKRIEAIQDHAAERRFRRHLEAAPASASATRVSPQVVSRPSSTKKSV